MNKNKNKIFVGIFVVLVIAAALFVISKTSQSILSLSNVNVGTDGQVYWTYYASASKPGEIFTFSSTPGTFIENNGSQVIPHSTLSLSITPSQPTCNYQLTQKTQSYGFLGLSRITYYALNNPEMVANIQITDSNTGTTKIVDGTTQTSTPFSANGGTLTVETQGVLGGKFNCPEYSNDVLLKFGNGQYGFYNQNNFLNYFNSHGSLTDSIFQSLFASQNSFNTAVNQDSLFTNSFSAYPTLNSGGSLVTGSINLGYPTFTITADQKYFASTFYTPPTDARPVINSISVPSQIQQNTQNSLIVNLGNNGNNGNVILTATSTAFSVSPSSINLNLGSTGSQTFNIVASNTLGNGDVTIKVCAVNQFAGNVNCVSQTKTITITQAPPTTFCGDNICQANENNATCPQDCHVINPVPIPPVPGQCKAWISLPLIGTILPDLFCVINNFVAPIIMVVSLIGGLIAGLFGYSLGKKKNKKEKWIPIVLGLAFFIAMAYIIFTYFWWGVAILVLLAIIKFAIKSII